MLLDGNGKTPIRLSHSAKHMSSFFRKFVGLLSEPKNAQGHLTSEGSEEGCQDVQDSEASTRDSRSNSDLKLLSAGTTVFIRDTTDKSAYAPRSPKGANASTPKMRSKSCAQVALPEVKSWKEPDRSLQYAKPRRQTPPPLPTNRDVNSPSRNSHWIAIELPHQTPWGVATDGGHQPRCGEQWRAVSARRRRLSAA
eukprot:Lankesteria_metandrocarpae@DN5364_c0_g2_i1.p1